MKATYLLQRAGRGKIGRDKARLIRATKDAYKSREVRLAKEVERLRLIEEEEARESL